MQIGFWIFWRKFGRLFLDLWSKIIVWKQQLLENGILTSQQAHVCHCRDSSSVSCDLGQIQGTNIEASFSTQAAF